MLLGPVVRLPFPRRFDLARVLAVRLDMFFQEPLRRFVLVLELRKLLVQRFDQQPAVFQMQLDCIELLLHCQGCEHFLPKFLELFGKKLRLAWQVLC